jgi:hypothetical protein
MDLNLYACGGLGVNIANKLLDIDINKYFIDTSKSNLKPESAADDIFILDDVDGAGKHRPKTYEHFKAVSSDVLIKFKPSEKLNIVLSSLSGGSGSVIAPLLAKELISNGYNTIVIGVDSKHSIVELDNTIKTLKTYRAISDQTGKSIALFYLENMNRLDTDSNVLSFIHLLAALVNPYATEEFDTTDLHNFINFEKATDNKPGVGILDVNPNSENDPIKNTSVVSTILLTSNYDSHIKKPIPEYLSTCIVTDDAFKDKELRLDNTLGLLSLIVEKLSSELKGLQDDKKLVRVNDLQIEDSNEDGIVL